MKFGSRTVATLGLVLFFALGLLSAPAGAAGVDRIPMSVDISAQSRTVGKAVGTLDASCADYRLCVWENRDYGGGKLVFTPGDQGRWDTTFTIRSAKNRQG